MVKTLGDVLHAYLRNQIQLDTAGIEQVELRGMDKEPVTITDRRVLESVLMEAGKEHLTFWKFHREGNVLRGVCDTPVEGVHPVDHARLLNHHQKYHGIR